MSFENQHLLPGSLSVPRIQALKQYKNMNEKWRKHYVFFLSESLKGQSGSYNCACSKMHSNNQ